MKDYIKPNIIVEKISLFDIVTTSSTVKGFGPGQELPDINI